MHKMILAACVAALTLSVLADGKTVGKTIVTVDPTTVLGPIKPINGVNNGPFPTKDGQELGIYSKTYADAKIPYARTHDAAFLDDYGGAHTIDVSAFFPNPDADPNDPKSYDFQLTDRYLRGLLASGTKVYYRLGQKIEHLEKKYHLKPKDYKVWAIACEHLIRHVNEGWADGHHWNITDWEIWNEPDNNDPANPECWSGTDEEFFEFFATAFTHLKGCFPNLRFGGPGIMWANVEWQKKFFPFLKERGIELDFYSWHTYDKKPRNVARDVIAQRKALDEAGFKKTENHITEWNYVASFDTRWEYSLRVERGDLRHKGAAYTAAVLSIFQETPADVACYYDARPCGMNGLYDEWRHPIQGYYPFYAWGKLRTLGTAVASKADIVGKKSVVNDDDIYVTAAKGKNGKLGILITRYHNDDNLVTPKDVRLVVPGYDLTNAVVHVTGRNTLYTERPGYVYEDGSYGFVFEPNSFVYVECEELNK